MHQAEYELDTRIASDGMHVDVAWDRRFWMVQLITAARVVLAVAFPAIAVTFSPFVSLAVYVTALITDLADGALARHWNRATRGGDWFDAFADRLVTTMSAVYGFFAGAPILACSLIVARDLSAVSMNELQSEGKANGRRARLLGIVTVTPVRIVTTYVLVLRILQWDLVGLSWAYWVAAAIAWCTFAVNLWLRREVLAEWFREPDVDKLLH
jgi:phosphatidylglycerophosphate synthase